MPLNPHFKIPEAAKPLDLDNLLGKPKNRIKLVGVELEGAWQPVPQGIALERDGSVFRNNRPAGYDVGELPIGPMQPAQLGAAIKKFYPQKVNSTCGMHVHMSFKTVYHYNLLADSEQYQETMAAYLFKWAEEEALSADHPIWHRINGLNEFCQKKFWPMDQIQQRVKDHDRERQGHRYTMIHYCWQRSGTVECRILPMMANPELATRAVKRVLDITNAYLVTVDKSRARAESKVEMANGETYEESIELCL